MRGANLHPDVVPNLFDDLAAQVLWPHSVFEQVLAIAPARHDQILAFKKMKLHLPVEPPNLYLLYSLTKDQ
jgi:hypothetical protein